MKVNVNVQREGNGLYLAVPEGDFGIGLHAEGATPEAALSNLSEVCRQAREFKPDLPDMEFVPRSYDVAAFFESSPWLNIGAVAETMGINPSLMRAYKRGAYISAARKKAIEDGLHRLGEQLCGVAIG